MGTTDVKTAIIQAATDLIQESGGQVSAVTARRIAERANVGLGLINYHFGSKDNLIAICVQQIISTVVQSFSPARRPFPTDEDRLADWACQVFDFLFDHPAISRISILNDLENYQLDTNTVHTQTGLLRALETAGVPDRHQHLCFLLVSAMQSAFLGRDVMGPLLGYDFSQTDARHRFIRDTVSTLFHGVSRDKTDGEVQA